MGFSLRYFSNSHSVVSSIFLPPTPTHFIYFHNDGGVTVEWKKSAMSVKGIHTSLNLILRRCVREMEDKFT